MIILFLLFLLQFSLGCACLAVNKEQEISLVRNGWKAADISLKDTIQNKLICCGFEDVTLNKTDPLGHPSCDAVSTSCFVHSCILKQLIQWVSVCVILIIISKWSWRGHKHNELIYKLFSEYSFKTGGSYKKDSR